MFLRTKRVFSTTKSKERKRGQGEIKRTKSRIWFEKRPHIGEGGEGGDEDAAAAAAARAGAGAVGDGAAAAVGRRRVAPAGAAAAGVRSRRNYS